MLDSLWREKTLKEVFVKIRTFRSKETAQFKCDSFRFEKGHLVHQNATHLLVHLRSREGYFGEYLVYELQGDNWEELLSIGSDITTQGLVFKDVNGDGYRDFVLEGYGAAGSGEKNFNEVYLYNPREHTMDYIDGLDLNPHFYPKKGIVTCYYNPSGGWSAQKYRLNWNKLELLEEIEVELRGMIEGTETTDCVRKIYRYRNGERYLFKTDKICDFPPEYRAYEELTKEPE